MDDPFIPIIVEPSTKVRLTRQLGIVAGFHQGSNIPNVELWPISPTFIHKQFLQRFPFVKKITNANVAQNTFVQKISS